MRPSAWPLDRIIPYPDNPKLHPPAQVKKLAALFLQFGIDQPIVVDEGGVILKGHGRRLAAIEAAMTEFPVVQHHGLSDADKRAMRIEDNALPLLGTWDPQKLPLEMGKLRMAGYPMSRLSFSEAQLRRYAPAETPASAQEQPARTRAVAKRGDLWTMGRHKLICGDSTDPAVWARLFGSERAAVGFTDPPYGVSYEAPSGEHAVIENDDKRRDALYAMLVGSLRNFTKFLRDDAAAYIWHASSTRRDFDDALVAVGLIERQYLMWIKPTVAFGRADYQWQHEPCFYATKGNNSPKFYGGRAESTCWNVELSRNGDTAVNIANGVLLMDGSGAELFVQGRSPKAKKPRQIRVQRGAKISLLDNQAQTTVWEIARDTGYVHPTQKPVELARRAIENSSRPGEIVSDAFLGSGTTLIAAEMTDRRCFGAELDPKYVDAIVARWEKLTGQKAVRTPLASGTPRAATPAPRTRRNAPTASRRAVPA
jgi:DNA modification methylase